MRGWIDALERQAGHIMVGLLLMILGAALYHAGVPKAEDVLPFALGVIARSMTAAAETERRQGCGLGSFCRSHSVQSA
jgi:hypothetical protein